MNLSRIFANAVARRVAFVVVGALVAFVVQCFGEAQAQSCPAPNAVLPSGGTFEYEGQARAACEAAGAALDGKNLSGTIMQYDQCQRFTNNFRVYATPVKRNNNCTDYPGTSNGTGGEYIFALPGCPPGVEVKADGTCGTACGDMPPLGPENHYPGEGTGNLCSGGCSYACSGLQAGGGDGLVIDGQHFGWCTPNWTPTGASCSVGEPSGVFPPPDSDGDGTSDGNDGSPNNPGSGGGGGGEEGGGEDGSTTCGGPGQPECAEDGSNGGSGKGNTSGGGGTCTSPPTSTGDAILAQIAFQTWATRCALAGPANGGNGGTGGGSGPGTGDGSQPDWTKGNGPDVPVDDTDYVTEQTKFGLGLNPSMLDTENLFGASSCPAFSITIYGRTVSSSDMPAWCQVLEWMRAIVLLMGAWSAMSILLGRGLL